MPISDDDVETAERRFEALRASGYAVEAHYDCPADRVVVRLDTAEEVTFAPADAEELARASPDDLAEIEITPGGLGLIWPRLDAGLYVPALKRGILGSRRWMAKAARRAKFIQAQTGQVLLESGFTPRPKGGR